MPDINNGWSFAGKAPLATYTATHQINSGTAIAAGATVTETITFTGLATTDKEYAISARDAITAAWPKGLILVESHVSAADTLTVTWKNNTNASLAVPASATWSCVVLGDVFR